MIQKKINKELFLCVQDKETRNYNSLLVQHEPNLNSYSVTSLQFKYFLMINKELLFQGELIFYINGVSYGVAAEYVPPNVFAVVDVYGEIAQVTVTSGMRPRKFLSSFTTVKYY